MGFDVQGMGKGRASRMARKSECAITRSTGTYPLSWVG
jgi:hypothetical protein